MAGQDRQDCGRHRLSGETGGAAHVARGRSGTLLRCNAHLRLRVNSAPNLLLADAPVGIFDSGVGGMSVLGAIHALLPREALLYVADSRYAPYGERDDAYIVARCLAISEWLLDQGVKALVVACNTATAQTIQQLGGA